MKIQYSILFSYLISSSLIAQNGIFHWLNTTLPDSTSRVIDIAAPEGYTRTIADSGSFVNWLQHLPLKEKDTPVKLYDGTVKWNQSSHSRIIDIDVGTTDLQQCADAVIRLRAEYLYSTGKFDEIHFNFTSGDTAWFNEWSEGYRPIVNGEQVHWERSAPASLDYQTFRTYLDTVFMYAGSHSLEKELLTVDDPEQIQPGDVFIWGGFPGHAEIVMDVARFSDRNRIAFLIAQSYMPAQDIHILKNPNDNEFSPWYILNDGERLDTPSWIFDWSDLKRFKNR